MDKLKDITNEVDNGLQEDNTSKEISIEDVIQYIVNNDTDTKARVTAGRVFQTNKKSNFIETLFKLIEEEIGKMESKNNRDSDNSFFNLNKKILSANIYNIKEIINLYGIDEDRLITFLVGTVIQSIYDKKD